MADPIPTSATPADDRRVRLLALAAGAAPLALYLATATSAVQFDDCAQFVLCARDGSAAHPPGFPVWVTLANLWLVPFGFLPPVTAVTTFVAVTGAAACALLFLAFDALLARPFAGVADLRARQWSALVAALACGTSATVWQWSNSVEVYSLQLFATALLLLGVSRDDGASWRWRVVTGVGLGIGLGNHHVSTVLLLPFLPWLAAAARGVSWSAASRALLPAVGVGAGVAALGYLMLMLRAGGATDFAFGQPDTPSRLWHHLSGGFFTDSLWREGVDYGGRAAVLGMVLLRSLWLFVAAFALGCAAAFGRARPLLWFALGYAALLLLVQLGRMHTPNMDSALLPALAALGVLTALGCARVAAGGVRRLLVLGGVALAAQVALNLPACDRRGYAAGDAVLQDVATSAPADSIVLVTSWELQTMSLLARLETGWRKDLAVLPSSFKGTHKDLFPRHWPELHAAVQNEYDAFLAAIAAVNPDWVYTDYFALTNDALRRTYVALVQKLLAVAHAAGRPVLCDRQTVRFLLEVGAVPQQQVGATGMLFALTPVAEPRPFPPPDWVGHPFLAHDLCAQGILHDYKTTAEQMAGYWRFRGDAARERAAADAAARLTAAWNDYLADKPAPRR